MDERQKASHPFFAYVPLSAPHAPHVVPEEYYRHYVGKPDFKMEDFAKYLGMVENIDTNFGKLLAKLKEWGIADNTLVIYLDSAGLMPVYHDFGLFFRDLIRSGSTPRF
jgi:arylsulfatase A-like enzyme